ncbi:MAG TPA: MOSC domain-containing protein [Actinomycetota bacterium]|nr:MOSC domain-containing protein [Actinomycetota bacterium]
MSGFLDGPGVVRFVNVGKVQELLLRGRPQPTGIFKQPVEGRVRLQDHGVEGDVQADRRYHGGRYKAVYSYTCEDYSWWEKELGVTLAPATFGENLTLDGISTTDARVGERWRIGSALLEVTQPREPCWKLGAKMGDKDFPRRFREAGRAGAYLAIVEEGDVGAGDAVEVVSRPSHPVSVGMLAYLGRVDRKLAQLVRQLASKDVSDEEWEELIAGLGLPAGYP